MNKDQLLQELNASQQAAVSYNEGPSLVIAGAGSGKTRVLTYKIAYLLENGVKAGNILALTFTNKAAREMKSRIATLVGEKESRYLWMGTFHSIAARLLRQDAEKLGFTHDYTIYDTDDTNRVIKDIVRTMGLNDKQYKPQVVRSRISMAKNHLVSAKDYIQSEWRLEDERHHLPQMAAVYMQYSQRLYESNAMDFDDILVNFYRLLKQEKDVREKWQQVFKYVLVDEYQDTNYVQYMLVKVLAEPQNLVCVVGDDAQSIYSFRGANIGNILSFQHEYAGSRLFKLERNYRSTQTIVKAANSLIAWNKDQIKKSIYSEKEVGEPIAISCHLSDRDEAEYLANTMMLTRRREHREWSNYAVLYRTNAQSRVIEDACRKYQIPYRLYGSVSFYQRKEIKDALAYIRLSLNGKDDDAFKRIINVPARGIGDTSQKKIADAALLAGVGLLDAARQPKEHNIPVSVATMKRLQEFAEMIDKLTAVAEDLSAYEYVKRVLTDSGLLLAAASDKTPEGQDHYENLQELLSSIHEAEDAHLQAVGSPLRIRDFMADVALITDQDTQANDNTPHVSLMTVHTAKGLEFPVVFVAGMEENLFPSSMAETPKELEEERRLLYVAITRAEERCYMTYARQRFRNGSITCSPVSRFVNEIAEDYTERQDKRESRLGWGRSLSGWMDTPQMPQMPQMSQMSQMSQRPQSTQNLRSLRSVPTTQKATSTEIAGGFPVGSRVRHNKFGAGTVLRNYRENGNDKIDIQFDTLGKKTLLIAFAKLEKY